MEKTIGVVGLWHLGCVLCASWSKLGNKVIGFDYDISLIEKLNKGIVPIFEPNLSETIQQGLSNQTISFSSDLSLLAPCDFIFLSYDTPVLDDDSIDTTILEKSVYDISRVMKDVAVLIVSSQSPVGFCRLLRMKLKEKRPSLALAYSPENLRLGDAIQCYLNPDRIILGTADLQTEKKCRNLFSQIKSKIFSMALESAEITKHGINSFLAMSIVLANHLADICESTGARIDDVALGMKSDSRIGEKAYLSPGIGFSGGTLGRDLKVMNQINMETGKNAKIFGIVHELNAERKISIVNRIEKIVGKIEGGSIGVLGLTYKPGTSTLRRSLPMEIVLMLLDKKFKVKVYDPKADYSELLYEPKFIIASSIEDVSSSVDSLVLLTEWEEFKNYDWKDIPKQMRKPIFFDTKNFLDEDTMISYGFKYNSTGRQP
jgi:UDPglucose 6-dehydrogenase